MKRNTLNRIKAFMLVISILFPIVPTLESQGAESLNDIPTFGSGIKTGPYDVGNNNIQFLYTNVTDNIDSAIAQFSQSLADRGFDLKEESTINSNRFKTFVGTKGAVYFEYFPGKNTVSIVTDPLSETVYKSDEPKYTKVTNTTLSVLSLDATHRNEEDTNGESYVITLEDGRYVIIDGGWGYDADNLYCFLEDNNKRSDGNIHIAAWILSHSHEDHYGCFKKFTRDYGRKVEVDYLVAAPGASDMYEAGKHDNYLEKNLSGIASDTYYCDVIRPHTGNTLRFCNTEFQILYTVDDYKISKGSSKVTSDNNASIVIMMKANGQKVLFTNDAEKAVSEILCSTYGTSLKCDIFQMNHHGRSGCIKQLVTYADPSYSMWPTSQKTFELRVASTQNNTTDGPDQFKSNTYLYEKLGAAKCFVSDGLIEMIQLPLQNMDTDIQYYCYSSTVELFRNDFNSSQISKLTNDELATHLFGADNYRFGGSRGTVKYAGMSITDDGWLKLEGDSGEKNPDRSQILLANDTRISKCGIKIECDYYFSGGDSPAFFDFMGNNIVGKTGESYNADAGKYWESGVWLSNKQLRAGFAYNQNGMKWLNEKCFTTYETKMDTKYHMQLIVSPTEGITLRVNEIGSDTYYTAICPKEAIETAAKTQGLSYEDVLNQYVKLRYARKTNVYLDNLRVSLLHHVHVYTDGGICKDCGAFKDGLGGVYSASVSLNGNIGLNFYMELADKAIADPGAYVQFTLPDSEGGTKTEKVKVSESEPRTLENGKQQYRFSCSVAAKEMADDVKLQVFTSGKESGSEFTYSVKQYADRILDNKESSDNLKKLIKAMLNYGSYAQQYFDYHTEVLANADLPDADKVLTGVSDYSPYQYSTDGNLPGGAKIHSATLILKSDTTIKCRFLMTGVDVSKLKLSEGWTTFSHDGVYYYTECKNIAARDLATPQELTVSDESGSPLWTLKNYSVLSYVRQVQVNNNSSVSKKNITKALYDYYKAADVYYKSVSQE